MKNLIRVWHFFRADAPLMALVLGLILVSAVANLLKPWPLAIIIDCLLVGKPWPAWLAPWAELWPKAGMLALLGAAILVLHFGHALLSTTQNYFLIKIGLRGLARVRNRLFQWLQRLSLRYHQGTNQGDLIYRASWDTYAFQTLFQQGLFGFLSAFLSLSLMVGVMWRLNLVLTLVALATVPLLLAAMKLFSRPMSAHTLAANAADGQVTSLVQQGITALPLTQSYTREKSEERRFAAKVAVALQQRLSQHGWEVSYLAVIALIFGLGVCGTVWLGAQQVWSGRLTVGQLLIFLAYLGQFYEPLNQLSHVSVTAAAAKAGTKRVFDILDTPEEVKEAPHARPIIHEGRSSRPASSPNHLAAESQLGGERKAPKRDPSPGPADQTSGALKPLILRGALEFDRVSFGYRPGHWVLQDVSFKLAASESAAIIGPSGAGKTTLIHLLPRFFDPDAGAVRLDDADLRELRLAELRAQISLVMQEPFLLPMTVAENIAWGKPEATASEIEAAARAAQADGFIQQLPQGYQTKVGEGAVRLSVGEKQRLNLARAFLKDAPILVLDEPTSALDADSDRLVVASLRELRRGRTTLIVAHRLSTIEMVDRVVVLENGRLTELGAPSELRRRTGYFARVAGDKVSKPNQPV